jgi:hypothetical protein
MPPTPLSSCLVSQDRKTAGFDSHASPAPGEVEGCVTWPVLAQLPWVGEFEAEESTPTLPADILPFADGRPRPYAAQRFDEADLHDESCGSMASLRIADVTHSTEQQFTPAGATDQDYQRSPAERGRSAKSRPEYDRPRAAVMPRVPREVEQPGLGRTDSATHRYRIDPPQPRFERGPALHQPHDSFAAQLYAWQSTRRSQTALIGMSLLVLAVGAICFYAAGGSIARSKLATEPSALESQPLPTAKPPIGGSMAAPLPSAPPLELSFGTPADAAAGSGNEPTAPITGDSDDGEDPIAQWLREQPLPLERTASKDTAIIRPPPSVVVEREQPVVRDVPPVAPAGDSLAPLETNSTTTPITPTPTSNVPAVVDPYPTTSFPAFPTTITLAPANPGLAGFEQTVPALNSPR